MYKKIALVLASVSSAFAMHTAELNINQYDLEAGVKFDVGQFNTTIEPDTTFVGITYLKGSSENDDINGNNNDINDYLDLNFMIKQNISSTNFKVGLGMKAVHISKYNNNIDSFVALPLGVEVGYRLPINSPIPISVKGMMHYAPKSLSFSDADSFFEVRAEAHAELMNRAALYLGVRKIDTNYENNNDITYNKSAYFGVRFSF
jgi:hypothetical protein